MKDLKTLKKDLLSSPLMTNELVIKYKVLLVPGIVLALSILIVVIVTIPQFLALLQTFKNIDELEQKKILYQKKAADLDEVNIEDFRKDLDTALVALPVEKNIPGIMGQMLVSLGGSGLSLEGISFSNAPAESDKAQEYTITIDVSGDETGLNNFLERVSVAPRLVKLSSIEVSKGIGNSISASIIFATFYQLLPKTAGSFDDKLPTISKNETQVLSDIRAKIQTFPQIGSQQAGSVTTGKLDPFRP